MSQIIVEHLKKYYDIHHKEPGFMGSLRAFFNRKIEQMKAVDDISFTIEAGEMVGFLGPNGAGKTTTLKVLSGLLCRSGGLYHHRAHLGAAGAHLAAVCTLFRGGNDRAVQHLCVLLALCRAALQQRQLVMRDDWVYWSCCLNMLKSG
jgi:ABC-type branched-subunit amino acid transport system ATPase component